MMDKKKPVKIIEVSPEIAQVIADGQRLITYIARNGDAELDPEIAAVVIDSKYKMMRNEWTAEAENLFMFNYDKLAKIVYPVTVESINAIIPKQSAKNRKPTKAESAVAWYRRYTLLALLLLLVSQAYWSFGHDLYLNLKQSIASREETRLALIAEPNESPDKPRLFEKLQNKNQEIDANYRLLLLWNKVIFFGRALNSDSNEDENSTIFATSQQQIAQNHLQVQQFKNILSAGFVLQTLQEYVLPLLYGLLGAFIFVLRSLLREIKALTYTFDSEIRYRLRLTLGSLGGMIIGWFLKPEGVDQLASLSPMALAFLMGYNVDVLFSLMDRLVDNLKQAIEKNTARQPQIAPPKT